METDASRKAVQKYHKEKIERIAFHVPRGQRAILKEEAAARGLSLNKMIDLALGEYLLNHPTIDKETP